MRIRDYLNVIRERLWLVFLIMAIVAVADIGLTLSKPAQYEANTTVRLLPVSVSGRGTGTAQEYIGDLGTEGQLVATIPVATQVDKDLGLHIPPQALLNGVSVNYVGGAGEIMLVTADASTPDIAVRLSNAFARGYLEVRSSELVNAVTVVIDNVNPQVAAVVANLQKENAALVHADPTSPSYASSLSERDSTQAQLLSLQDQLRGLDTELREAQHFGQIVDPAQGAKTVRSHRLNRVLTFGALIGLPIGIALVLLMDSFRDVIRGKEELEQRSGVEVLNTLPVDPKASGGVHLVEEDPLSPTSEAYRSLALTLRRLTDAMRGGIVLVTSAGPGEGRTNVVTNLGLAVAETGSPVVIVEADIRRPRAYEPLGADYVPGLAELLRGDVELGEAMQHVRPNLRYIGPGVVSARAELLLAGSELGSVLHEASDAVANERGSYDSISWLTGRNRSSEGAEEAQRGPVPLVLVDAGAVLEAPEALMIAGMADGVLLVARPLVSSRSGVSRACEQLIRGGAKMIGSVLVGSSSPQDLGILPTSGRSNIISILRSRRAS